MNEKSNFLIRRIHSLLAIIPVGLFLCVHLCLNSASLLGGEDGYTWYLNVIKFMKSAPLVWAAELIIIAIPILVHMIYGLWIVYVAKNNVLNYRYGNNWAFYLQRITALVATAFLVVHVILQRFLEHEPGAVLESLALTLQNPLYFILYAIGFLAVAWHFTNGLFTFLISWGVTVGDHSQKVCRVISLGLFVVFACWGIAILSVIGGFIPGFGFENI
ncbi:MAG: succinate dehydrogenase [Gracilibacteraceae bacterium]|nr:succinate dehydrogenase [Gracilibacteraceae bacterium]